MAGAPGGCAAVVSEWNGRRHVVVLCASEGAPSCGRETTRSLLPVTAEVWAAWLSQTKNRPREHGRQFKRDGQAQPSGARLKAPAARLPDRSSGGQEPRPAVAPGGAGEAQGVDNPPDCALHEAIAGRRRSGRQWLRGASTPPDPHSGGRRDPICRSIRGRIARSGYARTLACHMPRSRRGSTPTSSMGRRAGGSSSRTRRERQRRKNLMSDAINHTAGTPHASTYRYRAR